jgi:hypothetical protein
VKYLPALERIPTRPAPRTGFPTERFVVILSVFRRVSVEGTPQGRRETMRFHGSLTTCATLPLLPREFAVTCVDNADRGTTLRREDRTQLQQIDLHWRDLHHKGARRLLADGVDICIIQLTLGHASINKRSALVERHRRRTAEGTRDQLERRTLKAVVGGQSA